MDNTNNTRFNMPMSSIDSKGLQYLSDRLSKNPNSRFVCAIARLNPKGTAYIGMNKSGKEFVTIPVVADYPPFLSVHATHPMDSLHVLILVILTRKPE